MDAVCMWGHRGYYWVSFLITFHLIYWVKFCYWARSSWTQLVQPASFPLECPDSGLNELGLHMGHLAKALYVGSVIPTAALILMKQELFHEAALPQFPMSTHLISNIIYSQSPKRMCHYMNTWVHKYIWKHKMWSHGTFVFHFSFLHNVHIVYFLLSCKLTFGLLDGKPFFSVTLEASQSWRSLFHILPVFYIKPPFWPPTYSVLSSSPLRGSCLPFSSAISTSSST